MLQVPYEFSFRKITTSEKILQPQKVIKLVYEKEFRRNKDYEGESSLIKRCGFRNNIRKRTPASNMRLLLTISPKYH